MNSEQAERADLLSRSQDTEMRYSYGGGGQISEMIAVQFEGIP